jgi:hypothetical protein
MLKRMNFLAVFCLATLMLFAVAGIASAQQAKTVSPDLSVAGIRLGERRAAKAFLENLQPTMNDDGRPAYYFFNKSGTQVLKLTGASFDDRFLITEIEVYKVGTSYKRGHFQAEKIEYFKTQNDIFVGFKQSMASAITGIPNVDGKDRTGPKTVARKIGEPTERLTEGERETLIYRLPEIEIADETGKSAKFSYAAQYEFNDDKLKKFTLKISPAER